MPAIRDSTLTFIHHLDQNIPYLSEGQGFNIILIKSLASVTTAKEVKENSRICNKHRNNLRNDIKEKRCPEKFWWAYGTAKAKSTHACTVVIKCIEGYILRFLKQSLYFTTPASWSKSILLNWNSRIWSQFPNNLIKHYNGWSFLHSQLIIFSTSKSPATMLACRLYWSPNGWRPPLNT